MLTTIPARTGASLLLKAGRRLRVVDLEGAQVCDLMAFSIDGRDRMSNGRTFDYNSKVSVGLGDSLWSLQSRRMLTVTDDDVGAHDFLYAACSVEMFRIQDGVVGHHPNCTDNLTEGLHRLGIDVQDLPVPFNIFQNVTLEAGQLTIETSRSKPGSAIVLRAEMDLAIALSACSASVCNGGICTAIGFEILDD